MYIQQSFLISFMLKTMHMYLEHNCAVEIKPSQISICSISVVLDIHESQFGVVVKR